MADFEVSIDNAKLIKVVNDAPGTVSALQKICSGISGRANAMAAGYRSGVWHETGSKKKPGNGTWHDSGKQYPTKGNTPARYDFNVKKKGRSQVGLVYTANYAAAQENMKHNTLLKSI